MYKKSKWIIIMLDHFVTVWFHWWKLQIKGQVHTDIMVLCVKAEQSENQISERVLNKLTENAPQVSNKVTYVKLYVCVYVYVCVSKLI